MGISSFMCWHLHSTTGGAVVLSLSITVLLGLGSEILRKHLTHAPCGRSTLAFVGGAPTPDNRSSLKCNNKDQDWVIV